MIAFYGKIATFYLSWLSGLETMTAEAPCQACTSKLQ